MTALTSPQQSPWDPKRPAGRAGLGSRYDPASVPLTLEDIAKSRILQSLGLEPRGGDVNEYAGWLGDALGGINDWFNPWAEGDAFNLPDQMSEFGPGPSQRKPQGVATGQRELGLASSPNLPPRRNFPEGGMYPAEHRIEDYQGYGPPRGTGGQGSSKARSGYGAMAEQDKDISKFEQQIQTFRDRLTDQAEETIAGIEEYRQTGLQNLSKNKRNLRAQYSRQDKLWADQIEINSKRREDDELLVEEGYEDEVDQTNAYLTSMGVKNPTVYTDKPKNATEARVQATFLAGAQTLRAMDLTRQFARESLQNINMTGFSTAQSQLIVNATQQLGDVAKWLKDGMWKIDDAVMEKEMTEEQAANDALELANYAHIISNDLGIALDTTFAAMQTGVLGKYMDNVWQPDDQYFPPGAWLEGDWGNMELPMDVILKIQKANLNKQQMEETVLRMREIYGG